MGDLVSGIQVLQACILIRGVASFHGPDLKGGLSSCAVLSISCRVSSKCWTPLTPTSTAFTPRPQNKEEFTLPLRRILSSKSCPPSCHREKFMVNISLLGWHFSQVSIDNYITIECPNNKLPPVFCLMRSVSFHTHIAQVMVHLQESFMGTGRPLLGGN